MTDRDGQAHLTKSRYLAGRQCPKRLWLTSYARELATAPEEFLEALFEAGTDVGLAAHRLFPGGVLVEERPWEHAQAVVRSLELMRNPDLPAIFEAAFEWERIRIRADVLERLPDGAWGLREVKAATGVKEVHLDDVAVQQFVLEGSGLRIPSVELLHVNRDYVLGEDGIDWPAFFVRADLTSVCAARLAELPRRVKALHNVLGGPAAPDVLPDHHCFSPYTCEFWEHCTRELPEDWVFHLPGLSPDRFQALRRQGIERISEVPETFPLSATQGRVREVHLTGRPCISSGLAFALVNLGPPAFYLDFEAMNPVLPVYPGTRPYQMIPFQWSLHHVGADGELIHAEFLADGRTDPRPSFAASLVDALDRGSEPILVYSAFERTQLRALADACPELAGGLGAIQARLRDLLPVVRRNIYDPAFRGSFSLKDVAPALAPQVTFDDLDEVAEGGAAAAAMVRIVGGAVDPGEEDRLRKALLAYCKRDTFALVELHRALSAHGAQGRGGAAP
jgi:hypothetical protein